VSALVGLVCWPAVMGLVTLFDWILSLIGPGPEFPWPTGLLESVIYAVIFIFLSWGNGSAMRVSPVGFAFNTEDEVLDEAEKTASISHNHPEGVKGAQATALAVFLARMGHTKEEIRDQIRQRFGYNMHRMVDDIRPAYYFDVSCQGTVPEAIIAFLDSTSYEDAVRNAISLGGDSDTLACITGGIAEAFYRDVPDSIRVKVRELLTPDLLEISEAFCEKYIQ